MGSTAASGGLAAASGGITIGVQALSSTLSLLTKLNKPYGTCAPNALDSDSFLACWKHAIPDNQIPYYKGPPNSRQPGTSGWDFAICIGAKGGRAPVGGCGAGCDCSSAPCVCAPTGAVKGMADGSFVYANNSDAGPAQLTASSQVAATTEAAVGGKKAVPALIGIGILAVGGVFMFFVAK